LAVRELEEAERLADLVVPNETTEPTLVEVLENNRRKGDAIAESVTLSAHSTVQEKLELDDCEGAWSDIRWARDDLHLDTSQLEDTAAAQCAVTPWSSGSPWGSARARPPAPTWEAHHHSGRRRSAGRKYSLSPTRRGL